MPTYEVTIPTCGHETWHVSADSEEEAFEKASSGEGNRVEVIEGHDPNGDADIRQFSQAEEVEKLREMAKLSGTPLVGVPEDLAE